MFLLSAFAFHYHLQELQVYFCLTELQINIYFILLVVIETVVSVGYTQPDHLVIDWIARNLYWTCPRFNKIYVSRLNGSWSTVIIDTDLERPRGIAVDPGDGYVPVLRI